MPGEAPAPPRGARRVTLRRVQPMAVGQTVDHEESTTAEVEAALDEIEDDPHPEPEEGEGRKFAFNSNHVEDWACPVVTAGRSVGNAPDEIISAYDGIAAEKADARQGGTGVLSESTAKQAWREAVRKAKKHATDAERVDAFGEEIASILGWE